MSVYSLGISKPLRAALEEMGVDTPTPLQEKAIPMLVEIEADTHLTYPENTEPAFIYGPALIQRTDLDFGDIQGLILTCSTERAAELTELFGEFAHYLPLLKVAGLADATPENQRLLRGGAHIVAASPSNLHKLAERKHIDLSQVQVCVIESGQYGDLKWLADELPGDVRFWIITDEKDKDFAPLVSQMLGMAPPVEIDEHSHSDQNRLIEHSYCILRPAERLGGLKRLIEANPSWRGLIQTRTDRDMENIYTYLKDAGIRAAKATEEDSSGVAWLIGTDFRLNDSASLLSANTLIHFGLPDGVNEYPARLSIFNDTELHRRSVVISTLKDVGRIKKLSTLLEIEFQQRDLPDIHEIVNNNIAAIKDSLGSTPISIVEESPALRELYRELDKYDKEELICKFTALQMTRFIYAYGNGEETTKGNPTSETGRRLFVNIGAMDGFDWTAIREYIAQKATIDPEEITNVDVKRRYSFFTVRESLAEKITERIKAEELEGRRISVEYSSNPDIHSL